MRIATPFFLRGILAGVLALAGCDGKTDDDDTQAGPDTAVDTADTGDSGDSGDTSAETGDTDTGPDTGVTLPEGADCDPVADACEPGTLCCTECCATDATPVCTVASADGACPLPNLTVDEQALAGSLDPQDVSFEADECVVQTGCVGGEGMRQLLRFTTSTMNAGDADLYFGDPERNENFEHPECEDHDEGGDEHEHHMHFEGFAAYELLDSAGAEVMAGHKEAYCLMDNERWREDAGTVARYDCGFQGISMGWSDVYDASMDCQWVDVTGLSAGAYTLRITVDPEDKIPETDESDNVVEVAVNLVDAADAAPVTDACDHAAYGEGRNCGWGDAGTFSCTPGEPVTLSCQGVCDGTCFDDTVLRACDGATGACRGADALGANNDAECGSPCSTLTATCPSSGSVTALVGSWDASDAYSCVVVQE